MIEGATLDYSEELIGSAFKIVDNPKSENACGCGVSFDIKS
jgi:Fe-S cluster assembly iron-binding protein IscA